MGWFRSTPADGRPGSRSYEERLARISPGVPGRCPACDGVAYIDTLDLGHRYQIQHCKDCLHRWEYLFDADGAVVGLTELDEAGQPVARTRVRGTRSGARENASPSVAPVPSDGDAEATPDLRDPPPGPAPAADPTQGRHLTPAEWLREAGRR